MLLVLSDWRLPGHVASHLPRHEKLGLVILHCLVHGDAAGWRVALPRRHHNHSFLLISVLELLDVALLGSAIYSRGSVPALCVQRLTITSLIREAVKSWRVGDNRVACRVVSKVRLVHQLIVK